jgi:hypothetical protein
LAAKEDVLIAIRKIIRATDLHSRQLTKTVGLTAPQLLVLQAIRDLGAVAISRLSARSACLRPPSPPSSIGWRNAGWSTGSAASRTSAWCTPC